MIPQLVEIAKADPEAKPSLLVTSSELYKSPFPFVFALSLVKAAQRNLMQSLQLTYGPEDVFFGMINVVGQVSPEAEECNPTNIANKAWEWFAKSKEEPSFEVKIGG